MSQENVSQENINKVKVLTSGFFLQDFPATDANEFSEILSYWQKFLESWENFGNLCEIPRGFDKNC